MRGPIHTCWSTLRFPVIKLDNPHRYPPPSQLCCFEPLEPLPVPSCAYGILDINDKKRYNVSCLLFDGFGLWCMVFNATFYNISAIPWRSVLLMEETRVPGENHRPVASHWQTLSHNAVLSTLHHERGLNSQLLWWLALITQVDVLYTKLPYDHTRNVLSSIWIHCTGILHRNWNNELLLETVHLTSCYDTIIMKVILKMKAGGLDRVTKSKFIVFFPHKIQKIKLNVPVISLRNYCCLLIQIHITIPPV